jgi:hypothetical protein
MNALAKDIRNVIARHVETASPADVLRIAEQLLDEAPRLEVVRPLTKAAGRFVRLDGDREPCAADNEEWLVTLDRETGLLWTHPLDCGDVPHAKAVGAAAAVRLFDSNDWLAPTIREQLSIVDYERCDPAVDPAYFRGPYGWHCTRTLSASSPSGYAWYVYLGYGGSDRNHQSFLGRVSAVVASQQLGLGI